MPNCVILSSIYAIRHWSPDEKPPPRRRAAASSRCRSGDLVGVKLILGRQLGDRCLVRNASSATFAFKAASSRRLVFSWPSVCSSSLYWSRLHLGPWSYLRGLLLTPLPRSHATLIYSICFVEGVARSFFAILEKRWDN